MDDRILYIKDVIEFALNDNPDRQVLATKLGVSKAQISHYLNREGIPRLDVAGRVWGNFGLVIEPFTERAVIKSWTELTKDK